MITENGNIQMHTPYDKLIYTTIKYSTPLTVSFNEDLYEQFYTFKKGFPVLISHYIIVQS